MEFSVLGKACCIYRHNSEIIITINILIEIGVSVT